MLKFVSVSFSFFNKKGCSYFKHHLVLDAFGNDPEDLLRRPLLGL